MKDYQELAPQRMDEARLHIESEMVRRTGGSGSIPPGDRLDTVTDMLLILVDKYRAMGRLLTACVVLLLLCIGGLIHMTVGYFQIQSKMEAQQIDMSILIAQQRETRRAVSETKDAVTDTARVVNETKEAVEKAAEPPPAKKR